MIDMTSKQAERYVASRVHPPVNLIISNVRWKLINTHVNRTKLVNDADIFSSGKIFEYRNGYALYERNFDYS